MARRENWKTKEIPSQSDQLNVRVYNSELI